MITEFFCGPELLTFAKHVKTAYESAPSDIEIIGQAMYPGDEKSETLQGKVTYAWYWSIAKLTAPGRIAEIGVRFGYSAIAMLRGMLFNGLPFDPEFIGFDYQNYGIDSNRFALPNIAEYTNEVVIHPYDTQRLTKLPCAGIDLFSVDGDHSEAGAYHDMELAFEATRNGGLLLVDDVTEPAHHAVRVAVERFTRERALEWFVIETFRGLAVIEVKKNA